MSRLCVDQAYKPQLPHTSLSIASDLLQSLNRTSITRGLPDELRRRSSRSTATLQTKQAPNERKRHTPFSICFCSLDLPLPSKKRLLASLYPSTPNIGVEPLFFPDPNPPLVGWLVAYKPNTKQCPLTLRNNPSKPFELRSSGPATFALPSRRTKHLR